jgi:N-acetyl-anhydromuramyl-L-alanine amidase AmpD
MGMFQARKKTDLIVVHCSATRATQMLGVKDIDRMHRQRGFIAVGYHYVITRDGLVEIGRPVGTIGAHVEGFNSVSVGICMIGGVGPDGKRGEDNFTAAQYARLVGLLNTLRTTYPSARICGHRDLSRDLNKDGKITPNEWSKECPSFDVEAFLAKHGIKNPA